ncbi:glutamate receptor-interacting protein 2-like isoform X2 [Ornithodoros turicata]|uniref:glutamate receptor-interacting protein 2-like isoform X2 n=1 Tax=Ornithodoros turicata TaxID=34597 RepID=UPI003139F0EA
MCCEADDAPKCCCSCRCAREARARKTRFWGWLKKRLASTHRSSGISGDEGAYGHHHGRPQDVPLTLQKRLSFISEDKRGTSTVELVKKEGSTLGLILSGGIDKGAHPKIASLRPGSIVHRCDALAVGDRIVAVNGIRTSKLKHDEIVNLLKNAGQRVVLDIEYEIPVTAAESSICVCPKVIQVKLEKENGSFGFLIRGGACTEKLKSHPLTITHVRPGGPADRDGTIKSGDRLLAVDNINLHNASLNEAMLVLKQVERTALLTIEYDVSVMDAVRNASGPLLVEIDKTPGAQLGTTLTQLQQGDGTIVFDSIKQASIAERCGALHVGDQLLAIDGTRVDNMTPAEAMQLLKMSTGNMIRLEVLPISQIAMRKYHDARAAKSRASHRAQCYTNSEYNTLSSLGGRSSGYPPLPPQQTPSTPSSRRSRRSKNHHPDYLPSSSNTSVSSSYGIPPCSAASQLSHVEATQVIIYADHKGFGFALQGSTFTTELVSSPPVVNSIDARGPAEQTGVVQVGDRVLAVNCHSTEGMAVEEVTRLIQQSRPRVVLDIEFDVAESVIPSSGTFTVKLAKKGPGLGITITSPKNRRPGEPLLISDIKRGSVAHRTGTLQPGDRLLAIDSVRMDNCTIEDAAEILQGCEEVVKLRIRKDEAFCEPDATGTVVFTVELARHGGPLGITISGTEEPFDPIVISGLTDGGLAERTGALHVGDRILAINGQSLRGKPLSEAILLLQNSGDVVTLKISKTTIDHGLDPSKIERPKEPEPTNFLSMYGTPIPSVDSAVESWDSYGGLEGMSGNGSAQNKLPAVANQAANDDTEPSTSSHVSTTQAVPNLPEDLARWEKDVWAHRSQTESSSTPVPPPSESDQDWSKVLEDLETCGQSKLLRQIERSIMGSQQSVNPIPHASNQAEDNKELQYAPFGFQTQPDQGNASTDCEYQPFTLSPYDSQVEDCAMASYRRQLPLPIEVHRVTLFKDTVYEDFGFSVSDGLYERGVFVNRIRPGGPADLGGMLKPYDRILQVNDTKTHDFDCCLTVPLIASSGDSIELIVSRPAYTNMFRIHETFDRSTPSHDTGLHPWIDDNDREDCSSPQGTHRNSQVLTKTL